MRDDLSFIIAIVDRSGSMEDIKEDMQGGLNQFIKDQAAEPGECFVTLAEFDDKYDVVYDFQDIKAVKPYTLVPRGMTAMLDAIGKTITSAGVRLAKMDEADRPAKVFCVIITDGLENHSTEWSREQVKALLEKQQKDYSWIFTYLGANQDAVAVGASIGVAAASSMAYASTGAGAQSMTNTLSSSVSSVRGGHSQTIAYSDEDRDEATKS